MVVSHDHPYLLIVEGFPHPAIVAQLLWINSYNGDGFTGVVGTVETASTRFESTAPDVLTALAAAQQEGPIRIGITCLGVMTGLTLLGFALFVVLINRLVAKAAGGLRALAALSIAYAAVVSAIGGTAVSALLGPVGRHAPGSESSTVKSTDDAPGRDVIRQRRTDDRSTMPAVGVEASRRTVRTLQGPAMTAPLLAALVLVFVMGVAIQRGNTCTVVAFDDVVHRQSWDRLLAIVYAWFWVAGGLALLTLATGVQPIAQVVPITLWSVLGGLLLGIGAVVNGACTTGTIARIGSGEYAFGLTLLGFYLGCVLAPHLFGRLTTAHVKSVPTVTSLDYPVLALIGLAAVAALTVRRLVSGPHESIRDFLRHAWDPRTATFIIALLFVALVQLFGPWAYTDLLGDISRGVEDLAVERAALLAALLAGAVVAGRSMKGARLIGPLTPRVIRCFAGGVIMGTGFAVAPGAFDGLTLYGQPLLLPFAWAVMGASYLSILLGVLYLRSGWGARIKALRG